MRPVRTATFRAIDSQAAHYDEITGGYDAHYGDPLSLTYRRRFIDAHLTTAIRPGMVVLEAMCGPGYSTPALRAAGAQVVGLDVSATGLRLYRDERAGVGVMASMLHAPVADESVDCVYVVGGLHHVQPHLQVALDEVHRILRPGGTLCFYEPHQGSALDKVRRRWYRHDRLFEADERALDLDDLHRREAHRWEFSFERFVGSVGYLAITNSMVLRIPLRLKPLLRPLLSVEALVSPALGRRSACAVAGRWLKRPATTDG